MSLNPVIPHEGFWKEFKDGKGVDFFQAAGYIHFRSDETHQPPVRPRSVLYRQWIPVTDLFRLLSPAWFIKGNLKIWKLNYMFLLNQMTADVTGDMGGLKSQSGGYPE
jgi:hypothetical protein